MASVHRHAARQRIALALAVLVCVLLMALATRWFFLISANPIEQVERLVQQSGAYHFSADMTRYTDPIPSVYTTGRTSQKERLYLHGQTNLRAQTMELKLWNHGGSIATGEGEIEVRVADGVASMRQAGRPWQPTGNPVGAFAPDGDFLSYLKGVHHLTHLGREQRTAPNGEPLVFDRYRFDLNGPALAAHMKDVLSRQMAEQGNLPPGVSMEAPQIFAEMTGTGEIWIGAQGLPLRQILHIQFPDQGLQRVRAVITVNFSDFAPLPAAITGVQTLDHGIFLLVQAFWQVAHHQQVQISLLALVLVAAGTVLIIRLRHSRRAQTVVGLSICVILITEPLLLNLNVADYGKAQAARAAEQERQKERQEERQELIARQQQPTAPPHVNPLESPTGSQVGIAGIEDWDELLQEDDGTDSDGDGLTDAQETLLNTSSDPDSGTDSDGDGLSDYEEVSGIFYQGQTWYTDPLNNDTNNDGMPDGSEGLDLDSDGVIDEYDMDSDGILDAFDRDNDGDGVPDYMDDAPATSLETNAGESLNLLINGLEEGIPTLVDFQIRPENPDHLWYTDNVLDWPDGDTKGTTRDADGTTFADAGLLSNNPRADYGDLTLVPMLEMLVEEGNTQLPYADTMALTLEGTATDTSGTLLTSRPVTIVVDTELPQVGIATDVMSNTHGTIVSDTVTVKGTAHDAMGLHQVRGRVDGHDWQAIIPHPSGAWRFPIGQSLGLTYDIDPITGLRRAVAPDNASHRVTIQATDRAGNRSEAHQTVIVDFAPPAGVTITLSYQDQQGTTQVITPGDTVRVAPVELMMTWGESSDGSGIASYRAGWTTSPTPTLESLKTYAPDARLQHVQPAGEAEIRYAHLIIMDHYGNQTIQTLGPVSIDSTETPDLLVTDGHTNRPTLLRNNTGWFDHDCTAVGYSHALLHNRSNPLGTSQVQQFSTSWDRHGLGFAWKGTNWDGRGDLFLYLDTQEGGGQFAVSPYRVQHEVYLPLVNVQASAHTSANGSQSPPSASLTSDTRSPQATTPRYGRSGIALPFEADYAIYLEDTSTAVLLRWSGTGPISSLPGESSKGRGRGTMVEGLTLVDLEWLILLRLIIATLLSGLIGLERERTGKDAGLRTHMLVALGATMFVSFTDFFVAEYQPLAPPGPAGNFRVQIEPLATIEAIVTGISFLGAGTIFFAGERNRVKGLTTAASIWATAAVGIAVGIERYILATGSTVIILAILRASAWVEYLQDKT